MDHADQEDLKSHKRGKSHILRQLYKAAAVPAMMYRASVWLTPIMTHEEHSTRKEIERLSQSSGQA